MTADLPRPGRREEEGVHPVLRGSVSGIVRIGLVVSVALAAIAVIGFVAQGTGIGPSGSGTTLRAGLGRALLAGEPSAFAILAVAVLVATPLARVAASTALFAAAGNRPFTFLTLCVLVLLFATVAIGLLL